MLPPTSPTPFPETRWTLVQRLSGDSPTDAQAALEILCAAYWSPLYAVARYERMSEHDAQDAVQVFFAALLRHDTLLRPDPEVGKLRSLLLTSFKNYCISQWQMENRQKRGAGARHVPLHDITSTEERFAEEMQSPGLSAEKIYAREWARTVLDRSLSALRQYYADRGQSERFNLLEGPLLQDDDPTRLDQLAARANMQPSALRTALHRLRAHYRERIEIEIATTLDTQDPALIQAEVVALFHAFE